MYSKVIDANLEEQYVILALAEKRLSSSISSSLLENQRQRFSKYRKMGRSILAIVDKRKGVILDKFQQHCSTTKELFQSPIIIERKKS